MKESLSLSRELSLGFRLRRNKAAVWTRSAVARFTLGPYWCLATPQQRRQFLGEVDAYWVEVYWSRLEQYNGERLRVLSERPLGGGATLVATQLLRPNGGRPAELDWTVIGEHNGYKIIDLSIAGVSQAVTERSESGDLIARNGGRLGAFLDEMQAKTARLTG